MHSIKQGNVPLRPCPSDSVQAHFSGGDVTSITAGTGLSGGGVEGAVTLSVDPKYTLPQGCTTGQVAKWNGTGWVCAADNDTLYSAGTGLDLNGTTFSVEPDAFTKTGQSCPSGEFAYGVDSGGALRCAALPASAGIAVWQKASSEIVRLPEGEGKDVISLTLPAGTGPAASIALHGLITLAAADTVKFQCMASGGDEDGDEIRGPILTAIRVGAVTSQ